ncbi:sensor histidine kinase [Neolewinella agarilytica]|uniref:sensor histidine kinase n=1 Tax=Neolewinella agarilytica TaxID=478744 RepID=UPI002354DF12|nr:ATP-binding protein [Neolewinella agarilytica]
MRFSILYLLLLTGSGVFAQTPKLDSLVGILAIHATMDTERVLLHLDIAEVAKDNEPELHALHARAAAELSSDLNYPDGIHLANESLGFLALNAAEFDRAEELFTLALDYGRTSGNLHFVYRGLDHLGVLHAQRSENRKATELFEEALSIKKKVAGRAEIAASCNYLGLVSLSGGKQELADSLLKASRDEYQKANDPAGVDLVDISLANLMIDRGDAEAAAATYQQAAEKMRASNKANYLLALSGYAYSMHILGKLAEATEAYGEVSLLATELKRPLRIANVKMSFGGLYQMSGQNDQSKLNHEQALAIYRDVGLWGGVGEAYARLSNLAVAAGDGAEALRLDLLALEAFEKVDDLAKTSERNSSIAYYYIETGELEKARSHLAIASRLAVESGNLSTVAMCHLNSSLFHARAGRIDSARLEGDLAISVFEEADDQDGVAFGHYHLYDVEKEAGNFAAALEHFEKDRQIMDAMNSENARELIARERARQNVADAEEAQIIAEEQAALLSERNRLYLFLALALLGLMAVGSWFFFQLRRSKRQIEAQNLQLQQLNATKDKFFGIIAHDIRSPIVALNGVGEQMSYYLEKGKTDKLERLADRVDGTAKRLSGLLDNLLNWALLQQGVIPYHPKAINITDAGNEIFEMFRSNAEVKNISLRLEVEEGLKVHADEAALQTILRNLVSNAIKFTPEGGSVSIGTESQGDKVFITVNDTGTGISAEKMKQLFTLEKTSEPGTAGEKGTGLGLTLVKELAELNKGSLAVSSEPLRGSEFRVGLPMAA